MLKWAAVFLVLALIAALFGFTGIAIAAADIAKILFAIFVVLCLAAVVMSFVVGERLTS